MADEPVRPQGNPPIACTLSGSQQARRRQEVATEVFRVARRPREIEDGYEFTFPGSAGWAARLTEFVVFERACCPFFTFEIVFEPDEGPIALKIRGPEGVKEFIEELAGLQSS